MTIHMYIARIKFTNSVYVLALPCAGRHFSCENKVNAGMIEMYKAMVLPVMQPIPFGAILPYEGRPFASATGNEHTHRATCP